MMHHQFLQCRLEKLHRRHVACQKDIANPAILFRFVRDFSHRLFQYNPGDATITRCQKAHYGMVNALQKSTGTPGGELVEGDVFPGAVMGALVGGSLGPIGFDPGWSGSEPKMHHITKSHFHIPASLWLHLFNSCMVFARSELQYIACGSPYLSTSTTIPFDAR